MAGLRKIDDYCRARGIQRPAPGDVLPPLIERFDPSKHDDADAEALRERILSEIAGKWATPGEVDEYGDLTPDAIEACAVRGVEFVDANRLGADGMPEPVPLRELVKRVAARLGPAAPPDGQSPRPEGTILALGCRFAEIHLEAMTVRAGVALYGASVGGDVTLRGASVGGDVELDGASVGGDVGLAKASVGGDVRLGEATVGGDVGLAKASVGGHVGLDRASVGGAVWLHRASVGGDVGLGGASVGGGVSLQDASVGGGVSLQDASVGGGVSLKDASVGGSVWLNGASVAGGVLLDNATVGGDVWLMDVSVGGIVWLSRASVGGGARLEGASVAGGLSFAWSSFRGPLWLHNTSLSDYEIFGSSSLHVAEWHSTSRDSARFGRRGPAGMVQAARRAQRFRESIAVGARALLVRLLWRAAGPARQEAHWGKVRAFGELTVLTRAGNIALVGVPVLAALWPLGRDLLTQWAIGEGRAPSRTPDRVYFAMDLPWVWGALFFASVLIVLGRALYQANCPQIIREHSREDLMTKRKDEFQRLREADVAALAASGQKEHRDEAKVHLTVLEDALKLVQEAGTDERLRDFRHRNLVRVNGRTYWLPYTVNDFAYEPTEIDSPEDVAKQRVRKNLEPVFPSLYKDQPPITIRKVKTAEAAIPRTRLEVIAVMAGADAEYDIEARRKLGFAYLSRWCYLLAVVLIGAVLWHQGLLIFWEMGTGRTHGWEATLHRTMLLVGAYGPLGAALLGMALCSGLILWSAVFGRDPLPDADEIRRRVEREVRKKAQRPA